MRRSPITSDPNLLTRWPRATIKSRFTRLLAVSFAILATALLPVFAGFEDWATAEETAAGLAPGIISQNDNGDFNGDGVSNLAAYCAARSPITTAPHALTTVAFSDGRLRLKYELNLSRSDALFIPEVSSDLQNWTPLGSESAPAGFVDVPVTGAGVFTTPREASIPTHSAISRFIRLRTRRLPFHAGQFPKLFAAIADTSKSIRIVGIGSSVGVAGNLPSPNVQAPVQVISSRLRLSLDPENIRQWTYINKSINGATVSTYANSLLDSEVIALQPTVVFVHAGMNDGATFQFNSAQPPFFMAQQLKQIVARLKAANADVVLVTTPHPHSQRVQWSLQPDASMSYPHFQAAPVSDSQLIPSVADSIISHTRPTGLPVPASVRHLQVNQTFRQISAEEGIALIDAETHWFDLIAQYGEDALFDAGEIHHPNTLGHACFNRSTEHFVGLLTEAYQQHRRLNP